MLGFYSTHAKPYSIKLATLQKISGSMAHRASIFEARVELALADLIKVGALVSGEIKAGKLHIVKTPTTSQARHIGANVSVSSVSPPKTARNIKVAKTVEADGELSFKLAKNLYQGIEADDALLSDPS
jgi:predicted amino acid racemase